MQYKYSTIPIQYNTNTVQYKYSTIQIQYNTNTNTVQYKYSTLDTTKQKEQITKQLGIALVETLLHCELLYHMEQCSIRMLCSQQRDRELIVDCGGTRVIECA